MSSTRAAAILGSLASLVVLAAACGGGVTGTGGSGAGGSGGSAPGFTACDGPGQCVLDSSTCCGVCGMPELDAFDAVNKAGLDAHHTAVCPVPQPCPKCASQVNPALFAFCDQGTCAKADARTHAVSGCADDSDCVLRFGMGCCEPCSGDASMVIAVSVMGFQAILDDLGCDGVPCDACIPQYPMDAVPLCDAGHCTVGFIN